jgi:Transposase DDE domain
VRTNSIRATGVRGPDGTTIDLPDTPELEARFGRPGASRGTAGFPQLRLLTLTETGTHAIWALAVGRYDTSEIRLAPDLLPQLRPGMLCLADRAFVGFELWHTATASGADLLWRVRANQILPCQERLADGSYLSRLYASPKDRRRDRNGLVVRVIHYRLDGVPDAEPLYRLITTLLEPDTAPAAELAALYHERWESEGVFAELKVTLPGIRHPFPWLRHVFADGGYAGAKLETALAAYGRWTLEIVKRSDLGASSCCLGAGWSSARWPSSTVTAASPKTSRP